MEKIQFYVLNEFLDFEKKIYHIYDKPLPRPVPLKGSIYFLFIGIPLLLLPSVPLLGLTVEWIPWYYRLGIAFLIAHTLTGTITEGRKPLNFLKSVMEYHFKTPKNITYYKGQAVVTPDPIKFRGAPSIANPNPPKPKPKAYRMKKMYTIGADEHVYTDGFSNKTYR